jgi:hypothetical protein
MVASVITDHGIVLTRWSCPLMRIDVLSLPAAVAARHHAIE